jgi:arylsulfatase A-like enzyme
VQVHRIATLPIFAFVLIMFSGFAVDVSGNDRPNIVFLMSDDQCTFSMGCYGNRDVQTPNMDQLARDGMVFDNHYATTAICMASRANVMTGMLEYKTGCNFEHGSLLNQHWTKSYPFLLKQAGYRTGFAGKFGFLVSDRPNQKGALPQGDFDRWGGGPGQTYYQTKRNSAVASYAPQYPHSTLAYGAFGSDFIGESAKQDQPFCLSISFKAPHKPATPDRRFDSIYRGKSFSKPANFGRDYGEHFSLQSRQGRQYERFHSWGYADDYDAVMAVYHQQVYGVDVALGMIRDAIENAGVAENTVVIFTSDNGFMCGSHGYGSKVLPYEESSRVPMIIFDPRHPCGGKGYRCESLTGNIDIAPTILELAGIACPDGVDGESMLSLLDDPSSSVHHALPLINVWGTEAVHSLAVVTRDWKYIHWPYDKQTFQPVEELYNTKIDPLERTNLAQVKASNNDLSRMRQHYDIAVEHWKRLAVPYHEYHDFGTVFTRR